MSSSENSNSSGSEESSNDASAEQLENSLQANSEQDTEVREKQRPVLSPQRAQSVNKKRTAVQQQYSRSEQGSDEQSSKRTKRKFSQRVKASEKQYRLLLEAMCNKAWIRTDDESGLSISVSNFKIPLNIDINQLVSWHFEVPNAQISDTVYRWLFIMLKSFAQDRFDQFTVAANNHLYGRNGAGLRNWLKSNISAAKRFVSTNNNALNGTDRTLYLEIVGSCLGMVIYKVREMIARTYTLCQLYQQSKDTGSFVDVDLPEMSDAAQLLAVTHATFNFYQEFRPEFDFQRCLVEAILQHLLTARKNPAAKRIDPQHLLETNNITYQEANSVIHSSWTELSDEWTIVEACRERADSGEIESNEAYVSTHTQLRSWIVLVCKEHQFALPRHFKMASPIYSRVADMLAKKFNIPMQQKRTIQLRINTRANLSSGVRRNKKVKLYDPLQELPSEAQHESSVARGSAIGISPDEPQLVDESF